MASTNKTTQTAAEKRAELEAELAALSGETPDQTDAAAADSYRQPPLPAKKAPARKATKNTDRPEKPQSLVIEGNLHWQTEDGKGELVVTTNPRWRLVRDLATSDNLSKEEAFNGIMALIVAPGSAQEEKIDDMGTQEFFAFMSAWMKAFQENISLNLGE